MILPIPVANFHFGRPKTNFSHFEKWKAKKKKKKEVLSSFCNFPFFHFQFSTFLFTIFLLFFSISHPPFPCLFFPGRSAKISWSEVSGLCPPACYATACASCIFFFFLNLSQYKNQRGSHVLSLPVWVYYKPKSRHSKQPRRGEPFKQQAQATVCQGMV